jgi:glycosyltransferase involved in cell wall biosynthesis
MGGDELAEARAKFQLPDRFILFVGTVEPRKNLDTLLDAWVLMRDRPDLVVVGSWGWRYDEIRAKMERLGPRLHHLDGIGPQDLPAIYNLARALAHPAWYEGFGLPPLEAMACGTPVVAANVYALPEVCGDAAELVDPYDVDAIARGLLRVLGDETHAAALAARGIARAAEFTWRRSAERHLECYRRVVSSR